MNTYSDLQDIDTRLHVHLALKVIGTPEVAIIVGKNFAGGKLYKNLEIALDLDLLEPLIIQIELRNKIYDQNNETAVIVEKLQIDGIDLVPKYDYLATYDNDHNYTDPTSYLGFNGKWTLTFDRPFYQWLHQVTEQGWLLG